MFGGSEDKISLETNKSSNKGNHTKQYIVIAVCYITFFALSLYGFLLTRKKKDKKEEEIKENFEENKNENKNKNEKETKKQKINNFKKYKNIIYIALYGIIAGCYLSFVIIKH